MERYTSTRVAEKLQEKSDAQRAVQLQRFFKTGKGDYGEGDLFLGVSIPDQRTIARLAYRYIDLEEIEKLVTSKFHEFRMTGFLIITYLVESRAGRLNPEPYVVFYRNHIDCLNNWDLIDVTAPKVLGPWFYERDRSYLYDLAASGNLWYQRIAVLTTYYFIRQHDFSATIDISEMLLAHNHDLIHKAVGWMLREIGNRDAGAERAFLDPRYERMPRTMLRYAIEKFPEEERQAYLKGLI